MTLDLGLARSASCRHFCRMLEQADLTAAERGELLRLLRDTIAADRYPLLPQVRTLKSARSPGSARSRRGSAPDLNRADDVGDDTPERLCTLPDIKRLLGKSPATAIRGGAAGV